MQITISTALAGLGTLMNLAAGVAVPQAPATSLVDPTAGALPPAEWIFENVNGGNVTLYGTASTVTAQLKGLDPNWESLDVSVSSFNATDRASETAGDRLCCPVAEWNWPYVQAANMEDSATQLKNTKGSITAPPSSCVLAECWEGAGVWLCNDVADRSLIVSNTDVATMAHSFGYYCVSKETTEVCGQQFDSEDWNVVGHAC